MTNPIFEALKLPKHTLPKAELSTEQVDKMLAATADIAKPTVKPNGQLTWTENAILRLSGVCDGAHKLDDVGFNGGHAFLGNEFAKQIRTGKRLTRKQLEIAESYLHTYLNTQLKGFVTKDQLEADKASWPAEKKSAADRVKAGEVSDADLQFFVKNAVVSLVDDKNRAFVSSLVNAYPRLSERQRYWLAVMSIEQAHTVPTNAVRPPVVSFVASADKEKLDIPFDASSKETANANLGSERSVSPFQALLANKPNSQVAPQAVKSTGENKSIGMREADLGIIPALAAMADKGSIGAVNGAKPTVSINNPFGALIKKEGTTASRAAVVTNNAIQSPIVSLQLAALANKAKGGDKPVTQDNGERTVNPVTPTIVQSPASTMVMAPVVNLREYARDNAGAITIRRGGRDIQLIPDPSQLAATQGLKFQKFGCLTGAAGTGKTTVELILLRNIEEQAGEVEIDLRSYGKENTIVGEEEYQEYKETGEIPQSVKDRKKSMPAVACAAYTGKAMQQMKRALPESYHSRCFTIHKLLGFHPIFVDKEVPDFDRPGRTKIISVRKFVPFFDASNKLPWKIIVIDEASMVPIQLWNQLMDACDEDTRIMLIGDINQLPPVHGRSVFGFAMLKWPSFELTQIHRQKGEDNPIVDNAWRILQGKLPVAVPGRVDMIRLDSDELKTFNTTIKAVELLRRRGEFNPIDTDERRGDMIVVPQNKGLLGQPEINNKLLGYFNPPPPEHSEEKKGRRQVIIAGFDKKFFAVGDKVMVTVNDHEVGVTNGMTGRVIDIARNGNFSGVGTKMQNLSADKLDELLAGIGDIDVNAEQKEHHATGDDDNFKKRAASHIVTVDFGVNEDGERIEVAFDTTGGVNSLIHAYAATCHKLQGSECPTIIILCHSKNHRMLYREWLYTAFTRAVERVILLYDDKGLSLAVNRQKIKGRNLKEKAQAFIELNESADTTLPDLPEPEEL